VTPPAALLAWGWQLRSARAGLPALALLCGLTLGLAALGFFTLVLFRSAARAAGARRRTAENRWEASLDSLRQSVEGLSGQIEEVRHQALASSAATVPKSGLNLTKRSQALRMHRRGDPPEQIATSLNLPLEEVRLLIKVHQIVMSSI